MAEPDTPVVYYSKRVKLIYILKAVIDLNIESQQEILIHKTKDVHSTIDDHILKKISKMHDHNIDH